MRDSLGIFYPSLNSVISNNPMRDGFKISNFQALNLVPWFFVAVWLFAISVSFGALSSPIKDLDAVDFESRETNKAVATTSGTGLPISDVNNVTTIHGLPSEQDCPGIEKLDEIVE